MRLNGWQGLELLRSLMGMRDYPVLLQGLLMVVVSVILTIGMAGLVLLLLRLPTPHLMPVYLMGGGALIEPPRDCAGTTLGASNKAVRVFWKNFVRRHVE
jgi:hypothetical protein